MAKIKLNGTNFILEVSQTYDEVIDKLNDAHKNKQVSISLDEVVMTGIPLKRISIVVSKIIFIRE